MPETDYAIAAALESLLATVGREVTYRRGALSCVLTAAPSTVEQETENVRGLVERVPIRDWVFRSADLVLGGAQVTPERDDRIEETVAGWTHVFRVLPPASGHPWRYTDPGRHGIRLHTKQMETA